MVSKFCVFLYPQDVVLLLPDHESSWTTKGHNSMLGEKRSEQHKATNIDVLDKAALKKLRFCIRDLSNGASQDHMTQMRSTSSTHLARYR